MDRHPDQMKIGVDLADIIVQLFGGSKSAARKQIQQGAIRLNRDMNSEHTVTDPFARLAHNGGTFLIVEWLGTEKQVVKEVESLCE